MVNSGPLEKYCVALYGMTEFTQSQCIKWLANYAAGRMLQIHLNFKVKTGRGVAPACKFIRPISVLSGEPSSMKQYMYWLVLLPFADSIPYPVCEV